MSKIFNTAPGSRPKKNLFDLSHERKMSMKMGVLTPVLCQEVIPGDKWRINTEQLIRLSPLVAPMMHRLDAYIHYFFVPNRILWADWENFITGGSDGKQKPLMPYIYFNSADADILKSGSLADYLGMPALDGAITGGFGINALPFRAYHEIYNEYYRDQNLIQKVQVLKTSGLVSDTEKQQITDLRRRAWQRDYFTSCLPWSQRGDAVMLPNQNIVTYKKPAQVRAADGTNDLLGSELGLLTNPQGELKGDTSTREAWIDQIEKIESQITINDLRKSARLQEFLEKTARGGARLTEVIKQFFGVTSSDARLQRPEFIGGGRTPIKVSEVLSTFNTEDIPGANMYGHGIATGNTPYAKKFVEEHGWIIGIMSVLPKTAYQQGIPRHFLKFDKLDLYWPTFAQLGEQPVYEQELYFDFKSLDTLPTFGYQSRYAEYKYIPSSVHGQFNDTLDHWHMGRVFTSKPVLNQSFIEADPTQRVFAVTDETEDKVLVQLYHNIKAIRPIPYFNNPIL